MNFVIHQLLKNTGEAVTPRYRDALNPLSDEIKGFVDQVAKLFQKHQSGRIFGAFEENTDSYPFSGMLTDWLADGDFLNFSLRAAQALAEKMEKISFATGGYFFALQMGEGNESTVYIFMLSQNISHAVDVETLTLQQSLSLKTEQLDLAARIRIGDWQDNHAAPVSVVRGKKEVSEYFKEFIGLHQPHSNTEATKKIKDFADQWLEAKGKTPDEKHQARTRFLDYAKELGDNPADLHAIAALVDPLNREEFINSANDAGIDAEFYIDRRSLKAWERVQFKDKEVTVNFSKNVIGGRIIYSEEKRTLLIKNVNFSPEDLR